MLGEDRDASQADAWRICQMINEDRNAERSMEDMCELLTDFSQATKCMEGGQHLLLSETLYREVRCWHARRSERLGLVETPECRGEGRDPLECCGSPPPGRRRGDDFQWFTLE